MDEQLRAALESYLQSEEVRKDIEFKAKLVRRNTSFAQDIIEYIASFFDISSLALKSKSRKSEVAIPRHIAAYIINTDLKYSTTRTGQLLGGRDHTTVLNSKKVIEDNLYTDPEFKRVFKKIRREIFENMELTVENVN